jgi:hypothetical protein
MMERKAHDPEAAAWPSRGRTQGIRSGRRARHEANLQPLVFSIIVIATIIIATTSLAEAIKFHNKPREKKIPLARMSDSVSVQAEGRGNPYISLSDGHELITGYVGENHLVEALERNEAQPHVTGISGL